MKTVCFFGIFDPKYSRSRVLMEGFRENGWEIIECRVDPKIHRGFSKYVLLWKLGWKMKHQPLDLVIVAFPGQSVVWLARLIFGRNIIFDAFLSLYDSNVYDRKLYAPYSLRGLKDYWFDWLSCIVAKKVLLDTNEHIKYFSETFRIKKEKFIRVLIGADDKVFKPLPKTSSDKFVVEFHGMFIPLQGVEYILHAASILKSDSSIIFNIFGNGQTFKESRALADELKLVNVNFLGQVAVEKLPGYIADADICLGIFGDTEKTKRVIPNKVYECAAMGKAIITSNSSAIKEVFTDQKDMLFSKSASPEDLAEKISLLRSNTSLREHIARGARETFVDKCRPKAIVAGLITDLNPTI